MGAVTSKEGYNFQGKKFCKEIFYFFQNDGLPTHFQANSPSPFDVESVWDILNIWFSKVSTQNLRRKNVQPLPTPRAPGLVPTAVHFSADRLNRAEGEWLGRVQRVSIVGRSRWPQQYKFRSRCKYWVCSSLKKVPVNMLSSRANRQVLRACRLAISPFLRRNIQTSKPRSTFAKDLFLGRFNKVREMKI